MKARIVRIGNSQGIRIPKVLLQRSNLSEEVELESRDNEIVIRRARQPREGWALALQMMVARGDDELLDRDSLAPTQWDEDGWEW
jgi:antitoxin MazE